MIRVYDYYGSRELPPERVSAAVAAATGVSFTRRESSYVGEYYHVKVARGQELTVEPNELSDEDGSFLRREEFAAYQTIVTAKQVLETGTEPPDFLDDVRDKLRAVPDLEFLRGKRPSGIADA
jgi:hypothetical protein